MLLKMVLGFSKLLPEQASTIAPEVDHLYLFLVGTTIFFTVLIVGAILYFIVKFKRRSQNEIPEPIEGSMVLETIWTVIPFIISIGMFAWGAKIYLDQYTVPTKNVTDIYVVGKQWMWKFQHPEGQREINELHVPVGRKIRLVMSSEDVIHSFFVPAFRIKEDVVPGQNRFSTLWFQATKPGEYHLFCAEYCGTQHSGMIGWIKVMDDKDYEAWLGGGNAAGSLAQRGSELFQQLGCATCHRSDAQGQCPRLEGVYSSDVLLSTGQKVKADESYIRESILNPQAKVVAGFQPIMPTFQGQVSEEQLQQLIAYVKSIGPAATQQATAGATGVSNPTGSPAGSNAVARAPIMTTGSPPINAPQNERAREPQVPPAQNMQNTPANSR